jgi:hypothetical protein
MENETDQTAYLFVDIDGVLNTRDHLARQKKKYGKCSRMDWCPIACNNLSRLCRKYRGRIVVSSSWRHEFTLAELRECFERNGIPGEYVLDTTPSHADQAEGGNYCRGHEIKAWLDGNASGKPVYLILDDREEMLESQQSSFIKVDFQDGFACQSSLINAIQILTENGSLMKPLPESGS